MISSGADIVIGGHPHVIQPSTSYKDKQIINSLGNFIFDQMYQDAAKGNMLVIKIEKKEIISTSLIPIQINSEGFPEIID
jgi:poly-gamma-glutamate synthesis protein (capsule biosynthesis protein)